MSWWDSAYRSGHVPWDPGEYDRHLDWVIGQVRLPGRRVLDIGCGTGKSAIWLARRGFDAVGVDASASAIEIAKRNAGTESVRFIADSFPDVIDALSTGDQPPEFDLVMERATLQHIGPRARIASVIERIADIIVSGGVFYSLMLTGEGLPWGVGDWSDRTIRKRLETAFEIESIEKVTFTPGERGSVPAWRTIARRR